MGNEAPEAAGRSEVTPSVAYDEGDSVFVCVWETKTFHTNTAALREKCRLASLFCASGLFLTWECLFSPLIRGNTLALWQKSCLINQCLSACVGRVLAAKAQDMICTYLCSHSWHSLRAPPDKQFLAGVLTRTTCVLGWGSPYRAVGFRNHPQRVSLMYLVWLLSWMSMGGCMRGNACHDGMGFYRLCPQATEENVLICCKDERIYFQYIFFLKN